MLNHFTIPSNAFAGPVLITGAGGCIGAWTIAMLLKNNIRKNKTVLDYMIIFIDYIYYIYYIKLFLN